MESTRERALERLADLTRSGSARAVAAFAQLVNAPVSASMPVIRDGPSSGLRERSGATSLDGADDAGMTGVLFEFEGCVDALVGILFPAAASDRLVRTVVGIESGALDPTIVESALMEVGNILASHFASGIADALHARLLPSIPALAHSHAEAELEAWILRVVGESVARIEVVLTLVTGELAGRLVVVPTRASGEGDPGAER
ncbi:chemotaxis protein CheC [Myxococcota bacterium]|nr:chemotaxis protein CheC [Myxococcota bacterium]